ncbi:molybdopterin-dependent oxidoreductase [Dehalobacter sp. DCM]|uniref:molybdopterin-containing oxidoreductase family protein n=1 Tax=Dehalobacter sp. DCM TaxID=2907827 RepID=UPI003081AC15|nr:molybdopterin-dependent oxidoreductase [Dehalobacter sp. DCM]
MSVHYNKTSEWKKTLEDGTEVIRTCAWSPPGCHAVGCGLRLFVKDGELVKVEGDPEHPLTRGKLCVRCLALKEYIYHPDRIKYPMKRIGERGENKWQRITWDEAFDTIIEKQKYYAETYGPECIMTMNGTGREAVRFAFPLTSLGLGSPNFCYSQSGWSCMGPRNTVTTLVLGGGYVELDWAAGLPGRYDDPDYVLPEYILMWGKEPLKSNPDGLWGHAVIEMLKRGAKMIMVDPRVNWLSTKAEHLLRVKPNTDTALALGMLNVIINEDLYDHEFVDKWTYGFDQLKERVQQYPPSFAAKATGVPEEDIVNIARIIAKSKGVSLCVGLASDQSSNGVQLVQSLIALISITGNLDKPGGTEVGRLMVMDMNLDAPLPQELAEKCIGQKEYPALPIVLNTTHPDLTLETLETGKPYPIRMVYISSSNFIAPTNSAQPRRWYDAMKRTAEFVVATDVFLNPTIVALADIVLPVSSFAEHDGIVLTQQGTNSGIVGAINKAIDFGEAKSDLEILMELAKRRDPEALKSKKWESIDAYLDDQLKLFGIKFDELRKQVSVQQDVGYLKHERGVLRTDGQPGFNTTTGKVELYSIMFEMLGEDPLPFYEAPRFGPDARPDLVEEYPLTLITGVRTYTSFHSEHRNIPSLREITPDPIVEIHPETAAKLGIIDGDWVWIENMWGRAKEKAKLTISVSPDIVSAAHGWWFPEKEAAEPSLFGVWESNVNSLVPHKVIGKLGFGAPYKSLPCKVYKVTD